MFGEEVVEEASQSKQLEFDGIETKHFDECPDAYKLFKGMIDTIRAGKHIGEITGHETPTPVSKAVAQVKAGIALKPQNLRYMQFKQYVG
jgi:hypothetical protein